MTERGYLLPGDQPSFVEHSVYVGRSPSEDYIRHLTVQSIGGLLDLARQAVDEVAHSYRNFKVGSAFLVQDTEGGRVGTHLSGNFTPYKGADWNCAEKRALEVVQRRGYDKVLAIAVAGPAYTDSMSGIESPTCQPCHKCRGKLVESDIVDNKVLVASTNLDGSAFEINSVEGLDELHKTGQQQPFPDYHPSLPYYWSQAVEFDREEEKADVDIIRGMALQIRGSFVRD